MIKPKEITLTDMDGAQRVYQISRVPATAGREIFTQYATTAAPKIGNYAVNRELMFKMLAYVEAKQPNGQYIALTSEALIDNHVPDWETLGRLELEMVKYNTDFFHPERISTALNAFGQTLPQKVLEMLTHLLEQLSTQTKQH